MYQSASATVLYGDLTIAWSQIVEFGLLFASLPDLGSVFSTLAPRIIDSFNLIWSTYENPRTWRTELPLTRALSKQSRSTSAEQLALRSSRSLSSSASHFLNVLVAGSAKSATDPRDFVYAFLGHPAAQSPSGKGTIVPANYSASVSKAYRDVALYLLRDMNSLLLLSVVRHSPTTIDDGLMPSWVPRWNNSFFCAIISPLPGYDSWYDATRFVETRDEILIKSHCFTSTASKANGRLSVRGLVIDIVRWGSRTMHYDDLIRPTKEQMDDGTTQNPVEAIWEAVTSLPDQSDNNTNGKTLGMRTRFMSKKRKLLDTKKAQDGQKPKQRKLCQEIPANCDTNLNGSNSPYADNVDAFSLTLTAGVLRGKLAAEDFLQEFRAHFIAHCQDLCSHEFASRTELQTRVTAESGSKGVAARFSRVAGRHCSNRRFFASEKGYYGIGPQVMWQGDVCCVLFGARVPFILRPVQGRMYQLLGESYVHGTMRGEVVNLWKKGILAVEEFDLC